jgi:hypothetical protein
MSSPHSPTRQEEEIQEEELTSNASLKRKFIPDSSDWSRESYDKSIQELVQYETARGREPKPILPIDDHGKVVTVGTLEIGNDPTQSFPISENSAHLYSRKVLLIN